MAKNVYRPAGHFQAVADRRLAQRGNSRLAEGLEPGGRRFPIAELVGIQPPDELLDFRGRAGGVVDWSAFSAAAASAAAKTTASVTPQNCRDISRPSF